MKNSHTGAGTQGREGGLNLQTAATTASWVTPTACGPNSLRGKGQDPEKRKTGGHAVNLQNQVRLAASGATATGSTAETVSAGQLNPAHSRWLMGLPSEWCDCAVMAMLSLRLKRRNSSKRTKR
jgi:hypothetical protein